MGVFIILYLVYRSISKYENFTDLLPATTQNFLRRYEFDTLVGLSVSPILFLILLYIWSHWDYFIAAIMPDFLFGMSGGETFFALMMIYITWIATWTAFGMTPYRDILKETVQGMVRSLQETARDARTGERGIFKVVFLIAETVLYLTFGRVWLRLFIGLLIDSDTPKEIDSGEVLLEGRGVTKDFGGLRAVNMVDFQVNAGEIVGLLGPNGSGKTTLFNCISGVLPITEGSVYLADQRISRKAPWQVNRRGLARTFQKIRVYDNLPVYENMLLARKWAGVPIFLWFWIAPPPVRRRADELLEFLLLERVRDNLANNLSGGQQRLLEIGMSLMSNPYIVLLDEATSGVNPALIEEIKATIRRLNAEQGVTFLLIEHNMNFIMDLCERLYVLDYGTKIAEGSPVEIQNNQQVIEAYFGHD